MAVESDPFTLFLSLGVASLILLLVAFSSSLLNETIEENHAVIAGWLGGGRLLGALSRVLGTLWTSPAGVVRFLFVSALIYGFLDPGFGLSWESLTLVLGIVLGLLVTTLFFELPPALFQRRQNQQPGAIRVLPLSLVVALVCVLISRAVDFQPGYIYGLIAFYAFSRGTAPRAEGQAMAVTCVVIVGLAVFAWLMLPIADAAFAATPFLHLAVTTALVTVFVGGLAGLLFQLLPLRFLRGKRLWDWNGALWVVLFMIAAFVFVHVLIVPSADYLVETGTPVLFSALGLLIAYTLLSIGVWAYFRSRQPAEPALFSASRPQSGTRTRR